MCYDDFSSMYLIGPTLKLDTAADDNKMPALSLITVTIAKITPIYQCKHCHILLIYWKQYVCLHNSMNSKKEPSLLCK